MTNLEPPIYRATYELTIACSRFVADCHEKYKSTLGLLLQTEVLKLEATVFRINESENKILAIQRAIDSCYFVRMIVRLFLDLSIMKLETNVLLNNDIDECAKQLAGWKKSLE